MMRKKRRAGPRHVARKSTVRQSKSSETEHGSKNEHVRRSALFDFIYGVALSFAITGLAWLVGQYPLVDHLREGTLEWLQSRLVSPGKLPIAVVDISSLKPERVPGSTGVEATPRFKLIALIKALVQQQPKVIGIDIDFGPESGRYITPSDPLFFEFCVQQKRKGIPIYLGVFRTQQLAGEHSPEFSQLAASIVKPDDPWRVARWVRTGGPGSEIPTMASALATAYGSLTTTWASSLPFLFESVRETILDSNGKIAAADFLTDFSPLETLQERGTVAIGKDDFQDQQHLVEAINRYRKVLQDRMVLVGDTTGGEAADRFVVPGRNVPVPGVYVMACGAYTLATAPLFEIRQPWRVLLDAFIAVLLLVVVSLVRMRSKERGFTEEDERRLIKRLTWGIVILLFVVAGLLVQWTRVLWDDFLIVSLVLILHPSIEERVDQLRRRFASRAVLSADVRASQKGSERR